MTITRALMVLVALALGCASQMPAVIGGGDGAAAGSGGSPSGSAGAVGGGVGAGGAGGVAGGSAGAGGTAVDAAVEAPPPAFNRQAVTTLMQRVADYELARFGATTNNNWVRAVFYTGLMALYRVGGDAKYLAAARAWGQANNWRLGPDSSGNPRFADNEACVQTYTELYLGDATPANDVMIAAARTVFDQMVAAPMAGRVEWWWCDALFMAPPAMARFVRATGDMPVLDLLHNMWWDTKAFLYDPAQQLFWRDSTFVNTGTYWSRGNGWVVAGIARLLDFLPPGDTHRADYENLLRQMAAKLITLQGSDGYWRSNLLDPTAFPNPESSGTAFFTFALAWGINHGVLDRSATLDAVTRGWQALVNAVDAQGRLGWVQQVGLQPGPALQTDTNDYAAGALLLAGEQLLTL